ncbi:AAA family ATPase [Acinetobacter guillouiae]|jgi:predicted ATP-binding protein involved in virulence|uniref:AAA family ATPase n=1 Tax=Acinetobacter guillouiae TaxID=106649 RepID=UPI003AF58B10
MSTRHLLNNAQNGNFEAAVQVFLNFRDGAQDFEKSEEHAQQAFENAKKILESKFYLNELNISNFKKILNLKINLHQNLTVFIGENGVGKTTLLEAIRKNLMWIAGSTRKENYSGGVFDKDEVNNTNKDNGAYIDCAFQIGNLYKCKGRVARAPEGIASDLKSELVQYRELGRNIRILNDHKSINVPLFALYGIDRLTKDGKKTKVSDTNKIDGYDGSLNSRASFNTFIDWLVKLLKISNAIVDNPERTKVQAQVDGLLKTGADNKDNPLYELYEDLIAILNLHHSDETKNKQKKTITFLEKLFREIYPDLTQIQLINEDDGKDKVALHLSDQTIYLHQFSDGQRVLFGLIGDIARRLILLNDESDLPLEGKGIVLIDEVELHLHPRWQQKVILILRQSFPNIQFIVTTHSPHVISTVDKSQIRIIKNNEVTTPSLQTKGVISSDILEQIMGTYSVPMIEETYWVNNYLQLINQNMQENKEGVILFQKLVQHFGKDHPVISNINSQIKIALLRNKFIKKGE